MSKENLETIGRENLFDQLKAIYNHITDLYMIDTTLNNEGLENYSLDDLEKLYKGLDTPPALGETENIITFIYQAPHNALRGKSLTPEHREQCFTEIAKIYIKEYIALAILLAKNACDKMLFDTIITHHSLAIELDKQFPQQAMSIHISREEAEEKHFQAEETPSGQNVSSSLAGGGVDEEAVDRIRSLKTANFYNSIEILEILSVEFPGSRIHLTAQEMEAAKVGAYEIIQNILGDT